MNIFSHFWASYIFGVTNEHIFRLWSNLIIYLIVILSDMSNLLGTKGYVVVVVVVVVILSDEMLTWAP
jgi:hypothetical protein